MTSVSAVHPGRHPPAPAPRTPRAYYSITAPEWPGTLPPSGKSDLNTLAVRTLLKSSLFPPADQGQTTVYTTIHLRGTLQQTM